MSIGGIGGSHVGNVNSIGNTLKGAGSVAFDVAMTGATVAAGTFGGPAASAAMSSFRSAASGSGGGAVDNAIGSINSKTDGQLGKIGGEATDAQSRQEDFFRLQFAINTQSQTNNMVTNMQKARHDAMMATIQNTR